MRLQNVSYNIHMEKFLDVFKYFRELPYMKVFYGKCSNIVLSRAFATGSQVYMLYLCYRLERNIYKGVKKEHLEVRKGNK